MIISIEEGLRGNDLSLEIINGIKGIFKEAIEEVVCQNLLDNNYQELLLQSVNEIINNKLISMKENKKLKDVDIRRIVIYLKIDPIEVEGFSETWNKRLNERIIQTISAYDSKEQYLNF